MSRLVQQAREFAAYAHRAQQRKYTGEPYYNHLASVASLLYQHLDPATEELNELVAAAFLHDVLEDTDVPAQLLSTLFGKRVLELVLAVTDVSKPSDGNRAVRKAKDRDHLAQADGIAQSLKVADLMDNTRSIVAHDPAFAKVYLREKRELLSVLTDADPVLLSKARRMLLDAELQLAKGS